MTPRVSLVIISYEMERELPRTLLSLAPGYQNYPAEDCEIIVVDNNSRVLPDAAAFAGLKANLQILSCSQPSHSPARAINEGLARARAALIGVWIDGARMASPGLINACLAASLLHERPVIVTLNYQLGPNVQRISCEQGYDQATEDALLDSIDWPKDGYRLFDISTPEMKGVPTGAMLESNALFLPRPLWDELGGYDERFSEPGGSVVNPDTLNRAVALSGVQLIRVAGEGTFHQVHGGISTSSQKSAMNIVMEGGKTYLRLRGKPLMQVRQHGWIFDSRTGEVIRS
jgi:hypothetical protein